MERILNSEKGDIYEITMNERIYVKLEGDGCVLKPWLNSDFTKTFKWQINS